ncbi:zona pellucida-like domain-containing protein 1 [Brachyhypopomus gauderio]|uniref:zona pellucida-like domain-containing protein 1 n=1 Tax=Brachyhypopomus gauderio TaxID=698409 RepID=UPI004041256F
MWLALLYQLGLVLYGRAQDPCSTQPTFRRQAYSDITVICGSETLELSILICPVYFGGYNESMLALNSIYDKPECKGTPDWTSDPPVLVFRIPITSQGVSACGSHMTTTQEVGSGDFADFSSVPFVNISGTVGSMDPTSQIITYQTNLLYFFSCRYPLQYLLNKTDIRVSGANVAIKDNNGSFISTLNMKLYQDKTFSAQLQVPSTGLALKTKIFVKIQAMNLTERLNVLLDRCYATTSSYSMDKPFYDLFTGCNCNDQTTIGVNGNAQEACFSFETFRFKEQNNQTISTFYLHCTTRLCDRAACLSLHQNCTSAERKKREAGSDQATTVSSSATVSSGPIITKLDNSYHGYNSGAYIPPDSEVTKQPQMSEAALGVSLAAGTLGVLCIALLALVFLHRGRFATSRKLINPS